MAHRQFHTLEHPISPLCYRYINQQNGWRNCENVRCQCYAWHINTATRVLFVIRSFICTIVSSEQRWLHDYITNAVFLLSLVYVCIFHENRSNRLVHAIFAIFIVIASFSLKNVCMKRAIVSLYIELVLTLCWFQIYCVWVCVVFTHFYSFHSVKSTHARGGGYSSVFSHI